MILKEPTILAHSIATLDELSNGRAEAVFSIGNIAMLDQYHVDWKSGGQIKRLREAHHVMRTMLDEGKIDFEGEFYRYTGLFTSARPVQEHVPLKIGAMRGPKSFELAGEIADGMHQALAYSKEAMQFATDHVKLGAERAGRDVARPRPRRLDGHVDLERLRGGEAGGARRRRLLHPGDAARADRAARDRPRQLSSRSWTRSTSAMSGERSS